MADEVKASGIAVEPLSEFDRAMEEICRSTGKRFHSVANASLVTLEDFKNAKWIGKKWKIIAYQLISNFLQGRHTQQNERQILI